MDQLTDKVQQAASLLDSLPTSARTKRRGELRDIIEALRPKLEEAHSVKRYTWVELCEYLKGVGIDISVHTLKQYMNNPKGTNNTPFEYPNANRTAHLPNSKRETKKQFKVR